MRQVLQPMTQRTRERRSVNQHSRYGAPTRVLLSGAAGLAAHWSRADLEAAGEEAEHALNAALGDGHVTHSRQRRRDNHEQGDNN